MAKDSTAQHSTAQHSTAQLTQHSRTNLFKFHNLHAIARTQHDINSHGDTPEEVLDPLGDHMGLILALPCHQQAPEHADWTTITHLPQLPIYAEFLHSVAALDLTSHCHTQLLRVSLNILEVIDK